MVAPRLDTWPRYNVFRPARGRPFPYGVGQFSVRQFKILNAKRGGPTENWFCIDLVAIYEFGTYREFSVATENASLAR